MQFFDKKPVSQFTYFSKPHGVSDWNGVMFSMGTDFLQQLLLRLILGAGHSIFWCALCISPGIVKKDDVRTASALVPRMRKVVYDCGPCNMVLLLEIHPVHLMRISFQGCLPIGEQDALCQQSFGIFNKRKHVIQ